MRPEQDQLVRDGKMVVVTAPKRQKILNVATNVGSFLMGSTQTITNIFVEVAFYWLNILFGGMIKGRKLKVRMMHARTYEEWFEAASSLEKLKGLEKWKADPEAIEYDYELVNSRFIQLQTARELGDHAAISFLLRTSLTRNFAGIYNPKLYLKSNTGTKNLIEEFISEVVLQLKELSERIESIKNHVELKPKIELFRSLRHAHGNTALLLSGGGSLGVYHVGVMKAILEAGVFPRIIAGSSSGSIIAAMICTKNEEEYGDLIHFRGFNFNFMEPPNQDRSLLNDYLRKFKRWLKTGTAFDPTHIQSILRENLGDLTFLEAYHKTKRVLNIAVSSSTSYEMPCLLNYITAPNVLIWSAVQASCALPVFFRPVQILAKTGEGRIVPWQGDSRWIDGSVENDIPMKRLSELFNVNHFIVCQVNPHIYPFVALSPKEHLFGSVYEKCFTLVMSEIKYRLHQLHNIGSLRKLSYYLLNIFQQPYQGDINIVPKLSPNDYLRMFSDLDKDGVEDVIIRGLQATWPKIAMIKLQCLVEMTLDDIVIRLKEREDALVRPRASSESLLEAIHEASQVLSCTPFSHNSMDQIGMVDSRDDLDMESGSINYSHSILFSETSEIPPEFERPRHRTRSMIFSNHSGELDPSPVNLDIQD